MKVRKLVGTSVAATTVAAGLLLSAAPSSAADSVAAKMYVDGYQTKANCLKARESYDKNTPRPHPKPGPCKLKAWKAAQEVRTSWGFELGGHSGGPWG